jgi:transcriptional regulator with XRE-family HTH domain
MQNKISNIKERIKQVAENKGVPLGKFFKKLGISPTGYTGLKLEKGINSETIQKLISIYPEIDLYWLITGIEQTVPKHTLAEDEENYVPICKICIEKEKRIKLLEIQNEELKQDKQDFKNLLGLKNDKTA